MAEVDSSTQQWREMFAASMSLRFEHQAEILDEIRALLREQNSSVRTNSLEIARLKTWVALIGGGMGLLGIAAALLQALK